MKKIFSKMVMFSIVSFLPAMASANYLYGPYASANCEMFSTTFSGTFAKECLVRQVEYKLTLTPINSTSAPLNYTGMIPVTTTEVNQWGQPIFSNFTYNGQWNQLLCGDFQMSGTVQIICPINSTTIPVVTSNPALALPQATISCPCTVYDFDPRTPGYWKNHPEAWPVESLMIGNVVYSQAQLLAILDQPIRKDPTIILIKHLVAAKLNQLSGADASSVQQSIKAADTCLTLNTCSKDEIISIKDALDYFNNLDVL
jgi:hypothetical protein